MKKRIFKRMISAMLAMLLVFTSIPQSPMVMLAEELTSQSVVTQTVTTDTELKIALADESVDVIEVDGTITLSRSADGKDNVFVIPRDVTITGGQIILERAGIILGGDVIFKDIAIYVANPVRNAIFANGYSLTLENVTNESCPYNMDIFCGGISDYTGGNPEELPAPGTAASVTIKGTNYLTGSRSNTSGGNIFAGNLSDVGYQEADIANTYSGSASITIESGASGFGEIYAHGARENRDGGFANEWKPSAELYKVTGGVRVYLNTCSNITVHGATGGENNAAFIYTNKGNGSLCEPVLENVSSIELISQDEATIANLAPVVAGTECVLATLSIPENTRLSFANMPAAIVVKDFVGGGTIVFPQGNDTTVEKLTITDTVSGDSYVAVGGVSYDEENSTGVVKNGYNYISFEGDAQNNTYSFWLLPGVTNMEIVDDGNGNWVTQAIECLHKVDTIQISDFVVSQEDAVDGIYIPVNVNYATEDGFLAEIPMSITVNGKETSRVSGSYGYNYITGEASTDLTLLFDWDYSGATDGEALYVVGYDLEAEIAAGTYEIEITIPASNMNDGEEENLSFELNVVEDGYIRNTNAEELKNEVKEALTTSINAGNTVHDINIYLPADADAELFTAIRRALLDTIGLTGGSVNLTIAGATVIPEGAFGYDDMTADTVLVLKSATLPDATEIGAEAFYRASKLNSVDAPKATIIGEEAFRNTALKTINLPEAVTIGSRAFYYCSMTTISLPKAEEFASESLSYCQSLETAYLPSASSLGLRVFKGSQELTTIQLGAIKTIDNGNSIANHLFESAYPENIDLILSCGQKVMTGSSTSGWKVVSGAEKFIPTDNTFTEYTFKSITLAEHVFVDSICTVCGDACEHSFANHICTACGALDENAVATTSIGGVLAGYTTLEDAIAAVENCTEEDGAVVTLVKNVLLSEFLEVDGGVFTFDLNQMHVDGNGNSYPLRIYGGNVIITGNGTIENVETPIFINGGKVTIENGTFIGTDEGIYVPSGNVDIQGGTFLGEYGAYFRSIGSMKVSGDAVFEGTVADLRFLDNAVTFTSPIEDRIYSVEGNDKKVFAYGADDVTLDATWFTPAEDGYVIVYDGENNSLAYMKCIHETVEGITCTVCGCEMEAYIEQDGVKTYYRTLYDACNATTSLTDATVMLCKENAGSNSGTGGNYTLDLNGYNVKDENGALWLPGSTYVMKIINSGQYAEISKLESQVQLSIGKNVGINSIEIIYGTLNVSEANFGSCRITCISEAKTYDDITLGENYGLYDAEGNEITSGDLTLNEEYTIRCKHALVKVDSNGDGTHDEICNHCHANVGVNVSCTSGVYTVKDNVLTEKCESCGYVFGTATITCESGIYDGSVYTATVTGTGTLKDYDWNIIYSTADGSAPVNAGTYIASITVGEGENQISADVEFKIAQATSDIMEAPRAWELTYNSDAQELITSGSANGGKLVYSLTENGEYTTEIPTATDAGEYTVWYYVKGDENHTDSEKATVKVTIIKMELRVLMANAQTRMYDGTNKVAVTNVLLGGICGEDIVSVDLTNLTGTLSNINIGTYQSITLPTLTLTGADVANYTLKQPTEAVGTSVSIYRRDVTVTADAKTKVYGEKDPALTYTVSGLVEGDTLTGALVRAEGEDVGEYVILPGTLTTENNPNYAIHFVTGRLTITKAAAIITKTPVGNELTYNGKAQALVTAGTAEGGTFVYSLSENGTYTATIPTATEAGEYTVWYYVKGDRNHADSAKASVKVTIAAPEIVKEGWVQEENGDWYFYTNGEVDTTVNGITPKDDEYWYAVNGKADFTVTTVAPYGDAWWYVENGKVNFGYTGLAENANGWWYMENGVLNWNYTGLTLFNGIWFYVENGGLNWGYTGLVQHYDAWFYVEGGMLNWNYTGLVQHYDAWFYVQGGQLNFDYIGLVEYNGILFYIHNGQLNWGYTGLVQHQDEWLYVEGGRVNSDYTGLVQHYDAWFYVENGQLNWNYTGLVMYNGVWFYVQGGQLNWGYTGLTEYYGAWFYVEGGMLNWGYTGLVQHYDAWFYVNGGQLDWSYTGLCEYNGVWFYIEGGQLDWGYTGTVFYNGVWWYVENGIVVRAA